MPEATLASDLRMGTPTRPRALAGDDLQTTRHASSAVSWGAIFAGAAGAAASSLILLILGVGLGLSPFAGTGASATTFDRGTSMRSLLLLFLGAPLPIIILIALFTH